MKTEEHQERILEALAGREWLEEDALMELLDPPRNDEDARHDAWAALSELVAKGIVGRSYAFEDIGGFGACIGRVYYVWLKTAETAEHDRRLEELDREWAIFTGGMFGHDRELLDEQ